MKRFWFIVCLMALSSLVLLGRAGPTKAEERLALIVGNSTYGTVASLDNPEQDARLMVGALEASGFTVTLLIDANQIAMKRAIAKFGRDLRQAGSDATGLFYYAGHGVQSFGNNYLLPVDVALADAADLDLMAVEAQSVLRQMASARNRTNLVILDACRNNPFDAIVDLNDSGLAEMKAPTGTFLAYATAPGGVALDGTDGNSPFTKAVAEQILRPGLPVEQAFKQVRRMVLKQSNGLQTPWDTSSLVSDFMFVQQIEQEPSGPDVTGEAQVWKSVQVARDAVQLTLFLRGYPNSQFAGAARSLLAEVLDQELAAGTPPAAPTNPAVASANADPASAEVDHTLFEAAQADGSQAAYAAYLQVFPTGIYAEFVTSELASLAQNADPSATPEREGDSEDLIDNSADNQVGDLAGNLAAGGPVTFISPLMSDLTEVAGKTLAELIKQSPMFPPIEGLPETYWKDQTCSNCHEWTRERLCTQANSYLNLAMQRSLTKQHPYGGVMKRALKSWATGGCQ